VKKYVFEQCRNSITGSVIRSFDNLSDAISYADFEWGITSKETRQKIYDEPCGIFRVYEIDLTEEQILDIADGKIEVNFSDYETRQVKNYLTSEFLMKC